MDRNVVLLYCYGFSQVALLTEGVDRNIDDYLYTILDILSPSSRRAWIEIR